MPGPMDGMTEGAGGGMQEIITKLKDASAAFNDAVSQLEAMQGTGEQPPEETPPEAETPPEGAGAPIPKKTGMKAALGL